jgi:hypothetical protein
MAKWILDKKKEIYQDRIKRGLLTPEDIKERFDDPPVSRAWHQRVTPMPMHAYLDEQEWQADISRAAQRAHENWSAAEGLDYSPSPEQSYEFGEEEIMERRKRKKRSRKIKNLPGMY